MTGLIGRHEFQIDAKGRVSLPAPWRRVLSAADPLVLFQWQPTHLDLFPARKWASIEQDLLDHKRAEGDRGAYIRRVGSRAVEINQDAHGRIRVPGWILEQAGLKDKVLFVGALDRIELWHPARFEKHLGEQDAHDDGFAARIFG